MIPAIYPSRDGNQAVFKPFSDFEETQNIDTTDASLPYPEMDIYPEPDYLPPFSSNNLSLPSTTISIPVQEADKEILSLWIQGDPHFTFQNLSDTLRKNISKSILEALREYKDAAEQSGLFIAPVLVCAQLLLHDGNRIPLTQPFILSTSYEKPYLLSKSLLTANDTLTCEIEWSYPPCHLRIDIKDPDTFQDWTDKIAGIEILTSPQAEIYNLDGTVDGLSSVSINGSRHQVWNIPLVRNMTLPAPPYKWRVSAFISGEDIISCSSATSAYLSLPFESQNINPDFTAIENSRLTGRAVTINNRLLRYQSTLRPIPNWTIPSENFLLVTTDTPYLTPSGNIHIIILSNGERRRISYRGIIPDHLPRLIMYPTLDAIELILDYENGYYRRFPLRRSGTLGCAVWHGGLDPQNQLPPLRQESPSLPEYLAEFQLTDKLLISLGDCHEIFPSSAVINTLSGDIIAIAPAKASSSGLCEAGVYCFTSKGVWLLKLSIEGKLSSSKFISALSPLNSHCVAPLRDCVMMLSSSGLFRIEDTTISESDSSDAINRLIKRLSLYPD